MNKPLILVVEDDTAVRNLITTTLKAHDYRYLTAVNGESAVLEASSHNPDVILLDLGLPDIDGVEVIRRVRSWSNLPIIVISARSEDTDKIDALDAGADDYLTKPFDMQELLAVMKTILRRRGEMIPESLNLGNVTLNQADYTLRGPYKSIQLGKKEYDIMRILMVNRDMVVSKDTLLSKVWGNDAEAVENNVEIYISFLRKKLDFLKADVMIVTIRKLGYRIVEKDGREVL